VIFEASSHARTALTGQATEPGTIAMVCPAPSWSVFDRRMNLESEKTDGERVYRVTGKPEEGAEASTSAQPQAA